MTYTQFKKLFEQNAMNNFWFFSTGYQLLEVYPKFANQMIAEELKQYEAAE